MSTFKIIQLLVFASIIFLSKGQNTCSPPCGNGGTCLPGNVCDCKTETSGWAGSRCDVPICQPGCGPGRCTAPNVCSCPSGWTGTNCQQAICDEPCRNGGVCSGVNSCSCDGTGYAGTYCEIPVCDPPCNAGTCVGPNQCDCTGTGFSGPKCEQHVCSRACLNGYCSGPDQCTCNSGWVGELCETPTCDPPCINGGTCTTPGQPCDCTNALGWIGDRCEIPVCDSLVCQNNGTCSGPNVCDCKNTGYIGTDCTIDINECDQLPGPCHPLTECTNTEGSFTCSDCPDRWEGNGKTGCTAICETPCNNGGVCAEPDVCDCTDTGYQGTLCEEDVDECELGMCDPLTSCRNEIGSFECGPCPENYNGTGKTGCNPICDPPCKGGFVCTRPFVCEESTASIMLYSLTILVVLIISIISL